ncbi:MAG: antitoxin [Ectothiorhodospiraceae bacterium]|nr:antitoxin [Ectothiorhodospiraceae bacterium]
MPKSTVFSINKSQAVRLPKAVALPDSVKQVEVLKHGKARIVVPVDSRWDDFFDGPGATHDFMLDREQPALPERDPL